MKKIIILPNLKKTTLSTALLLACFGLNAQTNVFDDVIATSPNHTYLEAALIQENLDITLRDPSATYTVFAPSDNAFTALANALGTDINGLLALPNLTDILTYHVLGTQVASSAITNGVIVQPLSPTNTLKLSLTSGGNVFVNQAQVTTADVVTNNGLVHVLDGVLLPFETVVDIAIDNGFSYLTTAVVTAELLPALTNPLSTLTVFAPTNSAFDALASALGTDIAGLLALPDLADILTYHVLGTQVASSAITNGTIVQPLSPTNTLKLTLTSSGNVFVNQAQVTTADLLAYNGTVHVLNSVVLPFETVADIAIDNGFTSLVTAAVTAELLPALTNPLASLTVFAPTNAAFDALAATLGTDLSGLLANAQLADILLYHVVNGTVLSTQLMNGPVATLNGQNIVINLMSGVMVNNSTVMLADLLAYNGVVHVIDGVLVPSLANINQTKIDNFELYPNPSTDVIKIKGLPVCNYEILNVNGAVIQSGTTINQEIIVSELEKGNYFIKLINNNDTYQSKFIKL